MEDYSILNDNVNNYTFSSKKNTPISVDELIHVWLVSTDGSILIKKRPSMKGIKKPIEIQNLTIQTDNALSVIDHIKKQWDLECKNEYLQNIYRFSTDHPADDPNARICITYGYMVCIALDPQEKAEIAHKYGGEFVDYRNLEELFYTYDKSIEFKESFYSLLAELDNWFEVKLIFKSNPLIIKK